MSSSTPASSRACSLNMPAAQPKRQSSRRPLGRKTLFSNGYNRAVIMEADETEADETEMPRRNRLEGMAEAEDAARRTEEYAITNRT